MKIIDQRDKVRLSSLPVGQVFESQGKVFIKTKIRTPNITEAIRVENFTLAVFDNDVLVQNLGEKLEYHKGVPQVPNHPDKTIREYEVYQFEYGSVVQDSDGNVFLLLNNHKDHSYRDTVNLKLMKGQLLLKESKVYRVNCELHILKWW